MSPSDPSRDGTADRSWRRWTVIGIAAIWVGVVAMGIAAPDLVTGSQQDRLPLAALHGWIWGLLASIGFLWGMSRLRGSATRETLWRGLAIAVGVIWAGAVILAVALPVFETGTDPTRLPLGAIASPIGAALLTILAAVVARILAEAPAA